MKKIIIAVHGLGNKPPKELLEDWWKKSIDEGLTRINCKGTKYNFELVFWADSLHPVLLDPDETDEDSEYFLTEKYLPAENNNEHISIKNKTLNYLKKQLDSILFNEKMHINFPIITDFIIRSFFKDLQIYLTTNCVEENMQDCLAKEVIKEKVYMALKKHQDKEILLLTHSMGSIIAYDVLIEHEKELKIDTFITQGSPLAVPFIFGKIKKDLNQDPNDKNKLRTPECIESAWINLFDPLDRLAQYSSLNNFFEKNSNSVAPVSISIKNDYKYNGMDNPHKVYGYLRAKETAQIIDEFLCKGRSTVLVWLMKKINKFKYDGLSFLKKKQT